MANLELRRVDSYQFPAAHLGHLSDGQQKALDRFKEVCQENGYYHPPGSEDHIYASHDDETLLRFLRARKFSPQDAFKQLKDTEDWRKQNHIEELYDTIDINEYEESRRLYPQWTGRRDRRGIPLYVFQVSHLDSKTVSKYTHMVSKHPTVAHKDSNIPSKLLSLFALYENLTRFILPLCSAMKDRPHTETPISQSSNIVDISNVGLRQFWNLKNHMQDASQLATAYYPETLDRIFIIGAPAFFPTVWGWIKRWFDPTTVSKIFILSSSDMKSTLEKYIDPENIPQAYGGKLDFKFGDMPVLEPAIISALDTNFPSCNGLPTQRDEPTLPIGPIKWHEAPASNGNQQQMEAICVGRDGDNGKLRQNIIARVHTDFQGMHGVTRAPGQPAQNTPIDWSLEKVVSTPGTLTQPKDGEGEGDLYFGADLTSGTNTPQVLGDNIKEEGNALPPLPPLPPSIALEALKNGPLNTSTTIPVKPFGTNPDSLPVEESQLRVGTSDTGHEQQADTHATGQLNENTPYVVDYEQGRKTGTVEPITVGQAPKDVSANLSEPEELPKPQAVEQEKEVVDQPDEGTAKMTSTIANNLTGSARLDGSEKKETKESEVEEKLRDGNAEGIEDRNVEEYLRSKYPSQRTSTGKA